MRQIDIDQLADRLGRGAHVVDVREQSEWAQGHIPGVVNIPMSRLPGRVSELDRREPVYVVCQSGNRSGAMTEFLSASGFEAINVAGGTSAWIRSGRRTERA